MKKKLKGYASNWLPPVVAITLRRLFGIRFRGEYPTWEQAVAASTGYHQASILEKVKEAALKVKRREAVYERDSVLFNKIEYSWPRLTGLMWAAARDGGRLSVLDFGGSLGTSYFQNRKFIHDLPKLRWGIVEQAHFVACGTKHIQDDQLHFYKTIEECVEEISPNVALVGGALQFLCNPYQIIDQISETDINVLIIDRTPFSALDEDKISVQHVPASIYVASYPSYIFSRIRFQEKLLKRWRLVEEFDSVDGTMKTDTGIRFSFQGMLLEKL